MNNYYIYRHIRLDKNEVFYIGLGSKNRFNSKFSRNKYWYNITNKIEWVSEIILDELPRHIAEQKEMEFISIYGRKDLKTGTLCNLTSGGTGGLGLKHTEESKNKMKGRIPINKDKSKWNYLKDDILKLINEGYSESKIKDKIGCSNGAIYRIKKQIRNNN